MNPNIKTQAFETMRKKPFKHLGVHSNSPRVCTNLEA